MEKTYQKTMYACFVGYIVQAILNNFAPLLFVTFSRDFSVPMERITLLITVNFLIQLGVDMLSAGLLDRIGYRVGAVIAHAFAAAGLILLTALPELLPDPFPGLLFATAVYAVGGGLIEVLISPIMESCPTENKEKAMSLLHSFYCWGHMGVVLLSTAFFAVFGIENWRVLALFWALVPLANLVLFSRVPIATLLEPGQTGLRLGALLSDFRFWIFFGMMVCAGAGEQAVSQWASTFAEQGLGVSKTLGDLAGPMAFALLMGTSRAIYGKYGDRIRLDTFMLGSGMLCVLAYLCIALLPGSGAGLVGCGLCGLSVGILWPGTFSKASASIRGGGTVMFALLSLAGDLGCTAGPTLVGLVSGSSGDDLRRGILAAVVFPILLLVGLLLLRKGKSREKGA